MGHIRVQILGTVIGYNSSATVRVSHSYVAASLPNSLKAQPLQTTNDFSRSENWEARHLWSDLYLDSLNPYDFGRVFRIIILRQFIQAK